MKKILALILSMTALFFITSCEKKDDEKNTSELKGTLTITENITDATVKLELENENILGDETIKITVAEKDDSTKKSTKDFVKGTEDYKFESLTAATEYTASITVSGDLESKVANKDFTTKAEATTPGETPDETPGETPDETPGETPDETPGETPVTKKDLTGEFTKSASTSDSLSFTLNFDTPELVTDNSLLEVVLTDGNDTYEEDFAPAVTYTFDGLNPATTYTVSLVVTDDTLNNLVVDLPADTQAAPQLSITGDLTATVSGTIVTVTSNITLANGDLTGLEPKIALMDGTTLVDSAAYTGDNATYELTAQTAGSYTVEFTVKDENDLTLSVTGDTATVSRPVLVLEGAIENIVPTTNSVTFEVNINDSSVIVDQTVEIVISAGGTEALREEFSASKTTYTASIPNQATWDISIVIDDTTYLTNNVTSKDFILVVAGLPVNGTIVAGIPDYAPNATKGIKVTVTFSSDLSGLNNLLSSPADMQIGIYTIDANGDADQLVNPASELDGWVADQETEWTVGAAAFDKVTAGTSYIVRVILVVDNAKVEINIPDIVYDVPES